jgi:hypothetical protein
MTLLTTGTFAASARSTNVSAGLSLKFERSFSVVFAEILQRRFRDVGEEAGRGEVDVARELVAAVEHGRERLAVGAEGRAFDLVRVRLRVALVITTARDDRSTETDHENRQKPPTHHGHRVRQGRIHTASRKRVRKLSCSAM